MDAILVSVIASIIVAYITARAAGYSKNVTEERQKWRDRIREMTTEAFDLIVRQRTHGPEFRKLYSEFSTRLNPHDLYDQTILIFLKEWMDGNGLSSKIAKSEASSKIAKSETSSTVETGIKEISEQLATFTKSPCLCNDCRKKSYALIKLEKLSNLLDLHQNPSPLATFKPDILALHNLLNAWWKEERGRIPANQPLLDALAKGSKETFLYAHKIRSEHEFVEAVSRLLKHDWDRAIWETKLIRFPKWKNTLYPMSDIRDPDYRSRHEPCHKCREFDFAVLANIVLLPATFIFIAAAAMIAWNFWWSFPEKDKKTTYEHRGSLTLHHVERASPDAK